MSQVNYMTLNQNISYQEYDEEESSDKNDTDTRINDHDINNFVQHVDPENRGCWTHIENLDRFFVRMYQYYRKSGFKAILIDEIMQMFQYCFIMFFVTFLIYCVNYPVLFREDINHPSVKAGNVTFADIIYPHCNQRISFGWWLVLFIGAVVGIGKLCKSAYNLYHAYDIKLFYTHALDIQDCDLGWISWSTILTRVIAAQNKLQMCIHKNQITELDIYQRILRFENYLIAMANKKVLPLYLNIPFYGEIPYLSKGLKYNIEGLLFYKSNPWSLWENCWHLNDSFKDPSKRLALARKLQRRIYLLVILNVLLIPLILPWQILYFFFSYAELIKRSPGSLGLRNWSLYAQLSLRHFNELDHELFERLSAAYKPASKYLNSFPVPITTTIVRKIAFVAASILGVLIALSLYDEIVLTVEHMLTLITGLGVVLAIARALMNEEGTCQRSSEELLIDVLGHVHYLPADWKGRAHTKAVAEHFEKMFQFKAMYLVIELLSPFICPLILFKLSSRALDIVDFYRNFTVSVLGIGDVCSFAQMDIDRHGNPDWPATGGTDEHEMEDTHHHVSQYNQAEDGKTELSLVAFSCRNPAWRMPHQSQKRYVQTLRNSIMNATNDYCSGPPLSLQFAHKSMLGSYYNHNNFTSNLFLRPDVIQQHNTSRMQHREFSNGDPSPTSNEGRNPRRREFRLRSEIIPDKAESLIQEEQELSISTLHLYDLHISRVEMQPSRPDVTVGTSNPNINVNVHTNHQIPHASQASNSNEDTPLLRKSNA